MMSKLAIQLGEGRARLKLCLPRISIDLLNLIEISVVDQYVEALICTQIVIIERPHTLGIHIAELDDMFELILTHDFNTLTLFMILCFEVVVREY